MYLSKIELFGFKSFAHKVKITFDKGLTAIVGPNGCGKTNVVDAIRWVLGEQKSSLLRSTKMENIIFNGSRKFKSLSMSEVSITIENTRNILPTEYTEITVTRRVYRNGDSDYLLNQVPCRLKDILNLFADTGMGSDAYSVIELKMIEEIINNRSDERLRLFEEAAGITRYKQRRKQTFKQLENTTRDLERVDDVLAEVSKKVRNLKSQVRKAEQHHQLSASLKDLDLTLNKLNYDDFLEKLQPLRTETNAQESIIQELTAKIATQDSLLQESEFEQLEQEGTLSEAQTALNEKNKAFHTLEKHILQLQEQEKNLRNNIVRITESIAEKQHQFMAFEEQEKKLFKELEPYESDCRIKENELLALKKEQNTLQSTLALSKEDVEKIRESISEHQKQGSLLHVARQKLETTMDHLQNLTRRLGNHREELQKIIERTFPARQKLIELIKTQKTAITTEKNEILSLKQLQNDLKEKLDTKKEFLLHTRSRHDQLKNRLLLANSILDNYEGLPEGVAWLEKEANKPGYGCLSDLIELDDVHRKAVNALFGESLSYYVCSSLQEAKTCVVSLSQAGKGKVTFLILDLLRGSKPIDYPEIEGAQKIKNILSVPANLDHAVSLLTKDCYIARNLEVAEKLALANPGCTFVTPEGEKIGGRGILFGGSSTENEGLRLGKKAERERLLAEERDLSKEIRQEEKKLESLKSRLHEIRIEEKERNLTLREKELGDQEKKLVRMDMEHASRQQEITRTENEVAEAEKRMQTISAELEALLPEMENHRQGQHQLHKTLEEARLRQSKHEEILYRQNQEVQRRNNHYKDSLLELEKLRLRIHSCEQNRKSLLGEKEKMETEICNVETSLASTTEAIGKRREELESLVVLSGTEQQKLNEMETRYNECKLKNQEKRNILRDLRRKHEVEMQVHGELQRKASEFEKSIDNLITSVETRYNCRIEDIEQQAPENFDRNSAQAQIDDMRSRLERFGAINELALEEYGAEKERLDFLTEQKEDLLGAEAQLRATIEEINKTALKKFEETFSAVRNNFIRIFRELFEETDEADLLLSEEDDPLEAHIAIVAKPRGKKPLSIEQLSGGEKALTALSLLFAIYLVKPSPFCILDEVDAPLDDANIDRFIKLLKKFENNTQFIIVTHNKKTMASSQALYGVTMEEEGISKLIPVKLGRAQSEEFSTTNVEETGPVRHRRNVAAHKQQ
ncbi:chromosome segregation protein SMC [Prosthecochloris marina]|uniref:Chromosome partition protein Smc n=1 Tax=Prosthecochloris marina TaxID=2017681 RepID=A0A317T2Y1_9CHLB|nr:chromosome segregation protein SMC [Prosthecochloris marina]PWW80994.1 chromosome segregation protein SMC [Prosthecochloris marina]